MTVIALPVTTRAASAEPELNRMLALVLMACGMFMALLDTQIVSASIREIQAGLAATPEEISLVQTSYLIAEVIMIPLSGWLSRMLSTRWLFVLSACGFTLASLGCASAWNIESMALFRALQGFIGGAMIPVAFAAGFAMYPAEKHQAKVGAVLGLMATLAPAMGPTIGGWVTSAMSWRWLFLINIVPGIAISVMAARVLWIDRPAPALARSFDVAGAVLLALFLGCLQYTLDEGPRRGWTEDTLIASLFVVSAVAGVLLIVRCLHRADPLVDLHAFGNRNFAIGCMISFIIGIGMYCSIYLTPVFLGQVRGYDAFSIGTTVFITGVFQIGATFLAVTLRKWFGARSILLLGFATVATSFWLFSHIDSGWGGNELWLPQALRGMGTMLCVIPITGVALGGLTPAQLKGASGLFNLMRNLGGAIGLALINTELFYNRLHLHYANMSTQLGSAQVNSGTAQGRLADLMADRFVDAGQITQAALKVLDKMVMREALTLSFADVYLLLASCFVVGALLVILVRETQAQAAPPAH
jgi:MFS transporter, DHA2 family, multidrug resistance protein